MTTIARFKKSPIKWIMIALLVALITFIAFFFLKPKPTAPSYITSEVVIGSIEDGVLASGKIKALTSVDVGAQVSGEITHLYVKVGDMVKKGDLIAQIDEVTQQNSLSNAKASLNQSQASLESARANLASRESDVTSALATISVREAELKKATTNHERLVPLIAIDAISRQEFDDSIAALTVAKANLVSAKTALETAKNAVNSAKAEIANQSANIVRSQNDVSTAKKNLGYTTITAPMSGTVISVNQEQGATVNSNQSSPTIVTLADLKKVRIKVQISEADVINLKAGMKAKFNIIGNPDKKFDAILSGIEPAPETSSSSTSGAVYYIGYLDVDNKEGLFRIGMTTQVNIIINQIQNALTIPSAAISTQNGKTTVKVVNTDGTARPVEVVVGLNNRINAEIKSGLKVGDKVVIGEGKSDDNNGRKQGGPPMM